MKKYIYIYIILPYKLNNTNFPPKKEDKKILYKNTLKHKG